MEPQTPLFCFLICKQMKSLKWKLQAPWLWLRSSCGGDLGPEGILDLRPGSPQTLPEQLHNLRLSYKHHQFDKFLLSNGREIHAWSENFTAEQLRQAFREINLRVTCQRFAETDGCGRALLVASFRSPLCNKASDPMLYSGRCPCCDCPHASHDHIFWECPALNPQRLSPPGNPVSARFGWAVLSRDPRQQNNTTDCIIWAHMCLVVSKVWEAVNG